MTDREKFEAWCKAMLSYDQTTGLMCWAQKPNRNICIGEPLGKANNSGGYLRFSHARRMYAVHRVAWFLTHGAWPKNQIDHINGDPSDNRMSNLRDVPQYVNLQNKQNAHAHNKSGILGVSLDDRRPNYPWRACIKVKGLSKSIGRYKTKEEAQAAYLNAKRELHEGNML